MGELIPLGLLRQLQIGFYKGKLTGLMLLVQPKNHLRQEFTQLSQYVAGMKHMAYEIPFQGAAKR